MIPDNELSVKPVRAPFLYPDRFQLASLTEDYEMGGIALQDPSKGLQYQSWFCYWRSDNAVCLKPGIDGDDIVLFFEENLFELSFTFDQNMRWACATQRTDGTFRWRWYDSAVEAYVITEIPEGVTAFHCTHDDKRDDLVQLGKSDMLVSYIKDLNLYVRNQRERFQIEHLLAENLPNNLLISNFGMNERCRVQWRIRYRRPWEVQPWLL